MSLLSEIQNYVHGLTLRQKLLLAVSVNLVIGTLGLFVWLSGKANYRTLYSGLTPGEARSVALRLSEKNIPNELSSDATSLRVPGEQLDAVRMDLAAEGLPRSGRLGFELFDKPNWVGSDFTEKVNYQRALEGELERTIQTIAEVEAVRVHLVLPRESLFTEREREAKAAVMVKLRSGKLRAEATAAIAHLVSSAVDKLSPDRVTIVNADGNIPLPAQPQRGAQVPWRLRELDRTLADKLVATLAPVVGVERVRASVTVEYDLATSESTQETYAPARPGPAATREEKTASAAGKTTRHVLQPPGQVKRITAAVLVDDAVEAQEEGGRTIERRRKRTQDELRKLESLARAAIGFDPGRGDILSVQNLSFQTTPLQKPAPPTSADQVLQFVERNAVTVRYGALALLFVLVYVFLLRPVKKELLAAFRQHPRPAAPAAEAGPTPANSGNGRAIPPNQDKAPTELALAPELAATGSEDERTLMLKRRLAAKVQQEPVASARLIQSWIRQSEEW